MAPQVEAASRIPPEGLTILERGNAGLLSHRYRLAWEDSLTGAEYDKWRKLQAILETAGPEFRAAAMNLIILSEIEGAKEKRVKAEEEGQGFKVNIIDRGIVGLSTQVERLDAAFCDAVQALSGLQEAVEKVLKASRDMDTALTISNVEIVALRTKAGPWTGTANGAEHGAGISGYDSAQNVERLASQHRIEWEKKHAPKPETRRA